MEWSYATFGGYLALTGLSCATYLTFGVLARLEFLKWYAARFLCLIIYAVLSAPFPIPGIPFNTPETSLVTHITLAICLGLSGRALALYLEPNAVKQSTFRLLNNMWVFCFVPVILAPAFAYHWPIWPLYMISISAVMTLLLAGGVMAALEGSRAARFQIIAWAPVFIVSYIVAIYDLIYGVMMPQWSTLFMIAVAFEVVVYAIGFAKGHLQLQRERDLAIQGQRLAQIDSQHDPLTGLANRRGLASQFSSPNASAPAGVAIVDCDHFKQINDSYGHAMGDQVLITIAQALQSDPSTYAARMGGDEFVLLLYGEDWQNRAEELRINIEGRVRSNLPQLSLAVTASAGLATLHPRETLKAALQRADRALYAAKENGRFRSKIAKEPPTVSVLQPHLAA